MCGRFVITSPPAVLRRIFGYPDQPNFPPRHNVAPTQPVPVIIVENGVRRFRLMRWGLLPAWVRNPRQFALLVNARAETLLEKPAFRNAFRRRRCLIPADGYYEWQASGTRKRPFFIHRRDGAPMALAGLAETWIGPNGEELDTVAIVTIPASADLLALHHRMPATVMVDAFDRWLDCRAEDAGTVTPLLTPPPEGDLIWHAVSTRVNHTANDDAELILRVAAEREAVEAVPSANKVGSREPETLLSRDDGQGSLF